MNRSPQSIEEILAGAVELPTEAQRRKYVEHACGRDADLLRKVNELIGWHFAAEKFLDNPPSIATTYRPDPIDVSDVILGRYKLIEQIGEGSFGAVFRAEQREPVRRFVAVKILKPGMNTREVVARFEAERQALALMDHPNIARVFDAGSTDEGRPFFVMELVRGIPITEYADHARLTMKSRLELFIKVCHAVQHAHQKGIIHRDIKPSNVLVSMDEGDPVPKVIDFGVAKAINQRLTAGTVNTHFAQLVGTPLYMSPEQAEMSPIEIDTRSDIYSLGVLLYELLTGTTPLAKERLSDVSFDELRRLIREDHPLCPSARLSTLGNLSDTVADLRRTDSRKLTHIVRGELDWIVMKSLEKDRTLRYETADAFARDIQRYLNNEPVEACRPSSMYRLRKFISRNRAAVATATIVLATLITGLAVSRHLIGRERDRAVDAANAERKAADKAAEQATIADAAAMEARAERTVAVRERNIALENLYFAHMQLAQQDWQSGQVNRMHESLDAHLPKSGESDLRGWEWYYLLSLCHRDERTLSGHTGGLMSLAVSPDGKRAASAGIDLTIRLWDLESGRELSVLRGHEKPICTLAWNPVGTEILAGDYGGNIVVWDTTTGTKRYANKMGDCAFAVAWSPDGKQFAGGASAVTDGAGKLREGGIYIWETATGNRLQSLSVDGGEMIRSLAWSPDGKQLLAGENFRGQLRVWDPAAGKVLHAFRAHEHYITSISFSPDGKQFVTTSLDQTIRIWEAGTWKNLVKKREVHRGNVLAIDWSRDGKLIATASEDGLIKIWSPSDGSELGAIRGHRGVVAAVRWMDEGRRLVSAGSDMTVKLWNREAEPEARTLDGSARAAWSPDGRLLATSSLQKEGDNEQSIDLIEAATGERMVRLPFEPKQYPGGISWSPDGKRIAATFSGVGKVIVWDLATRKRVLDVASHAHEARGICWSSDSKILATSGVDRVVRLWDVDAGKAVHELKGHNAPLGSVEFSPDGKMIAVASWDREVRIWEPATERVVHTFQRPGAFQADGQSAVVWSPSGDLLAAACSTGEVLIWNAATGREVRVLRGHTSPLRSIAWSPDGRRLASGGYDRFLKIWDLESGRELLSLGGQTHSIDVVAWNSDGKRLISAGWGEVKLWDATKGHELSLPAKLK